MMLDTIGLSIQERGILAIGAASTRLDVLSRPSRRLVSSVQVAEQTRTRNYHSRGKEWKVEWQDCGQPLPPWFDPVVQGFADLLTLPKNWDSYGAGPTNPLLVDQALNFVNEHLLPSSPAPRVVPLSSGGLQLEWHRKGMDLEIMFEPNEAPYFYSRNRATGEEEENDLPEGSAALISTIRALE